MTDQIPADKVREIIARHRDGASHRGGMILADLEALLPPRPTLAGMSPGERRACQWMQADTETCGRVVIILPEANGGLAALLNRWGNVIYEDHEQITPRPDLPRMTWPGTEKPTPALPSGWRLADHKDNGRVIVTNPTPARDGRVYYVLPSADPLGFDWLFCHAAELTYLDQEDDQ